ncbi:unnamed protein product, partial [Tetraodon nigroviridis]
SSKADQVEREVPGQTPERADGGGRQAGSVSTCEFEVFKDISIKPAAFAPVESPNGSCAPPAELFDIILDENQLEDACEHLADYLEAYWKATGPPSSNPPNGLLNRTMATAALAASPEPVSNLQVQVLTSLRRNLDLWPDMDGAVAHEGKEEEHAL